MPGVPCRAIPVAHLPNSASPGRPAANCVSYNLSGRAKVPGFRAAKDARNNAHRDVSRRGTRESGSQLQKGTTMSLGLLGLKVGMTQIYEANGRIAPVTVLQVGPCPVLQVKTKGQKRSGSDKSAPGDGYDAVQVGFIDKPRRKAIRAERGHVAADLVSKRRAKRTAAGVTPPPKANCEPQRYMREFRLEEPATVAGGPVLTRAWGCQGRQ